MYLSLLKSDFIQPTALPLHFRFLPTVINVSKRNQGNRGRIKKIAIMSSLSETVSMT